MTALKNYNRFIIPIVLTAQTIYCWWCFYEAKSLAYDDNYGILILAVVLSIITWVIVRMVKTWGKKWIELDTKMLFVWYFIGSPIPFILAFFFYSSLFGSLST
jgi:hypothetical protein